MKGRDVLKIINDSRAAEHIFVKWNRKENDFADFDLIDRFIDNLSASDEIGDIDLLTMEKMWSEIKRIAGDRVRIIKTDTAENVEWTHKGKSGVTTQTCPYTPNTLITIFDVETRVMQSVKLAACLVPAS